MMAAALDPLGPAPAATNDYASAVRVPWGAMLNDRLSDCVCADTGHALMLRTANVGKIVVPTDDEIEQLYAAVGGYVPGNPATDQGCYESDMVAHLARSGFLGHKADAVGSVSPSSVDHLVWCVQLFGACRIGLNLPGYAEDQLDAGRPWDVSAAGDQSTSGHDVPLVDYRGGMFTCVTWGYAHPVTPAFVVKYAEEAHSELFFDWASAQGAAPPGFDLADLAAKMRSVDS